MGSIPGSAEIETGRYPSQSFLPAHYYEELIEMEDIPIFPEGKCPACGHPGFVARPYQEESKCWHCGAEFYGCDQEVERRILEG